MSKEIDNFFRDIQNNIIDNFNSLESSKKDVYDDVWNRADGGGGRSYIIKSGKFFDNCAVNFSSISGNKLPPSALKENTKKNGKFSATGVSVISHPKNPFVPTSHFNIRIFRIFDKKDNLIDFWIGGGYDLTPYFPYQKDCIDWHNNSKEYLANFNRSLYKKFSNNCNKYFYIPHREERRGIGGIFFDNFKQYSLEKSLDLLKMTSHTYINSYMNIANKRNKCLYNKNHKNFQEYRRGRYVEFNLMYDRGTLFGLQSKGRIKSILSSLPKNVQFHYEIDKEMKKYEKRLLKYINKDWNV